MMMIPRLILHSDESTKENVDADIADFIITTVQGITTVATRNYSAEVIYDTIEEYIIRWLHKSTENIEKKLPKLI